MSDANSSLKVKTSQSDPLRIDEVRVNGFPGIIGITLCPGKVQDFGKTGRWRRSLPADLASIQKWGATAWVNLVRPFEMEVLGVTDMPAIVAGAGIAYYHLPITDQGVPDAEFETAWVLKGEELRGVLRQGRKVLIHCMGGLGRSGTIAAKLLVEMGTNSPEEAIRVVRKARPNAIENIEQERYVLGCKEDQKI